MSRHHANKPRFHTGDTEQAVLLDFLSVTQNCDWVRISTFNELVQLARDSEALQQQRLHNRLYAWWNEQNFKGRILALAGVDAEGVESDNIALTAYAHRLPVALSRMTSPLVFLEQWPTNNREECIEALQAFDAKFTERPEELQSVSKEQMDAAFCDEIQGFTVEMLAAWRKALPEYSGAVVQQKKRHIDLENGGISDVAEQEPEEEWKPRPGQNVLEANVQESRIREFQTLFPHAETAPAILCDLVAGVWTFTDADKREIIAAFCKMCGTDTNLMHLMEKCFGFEVGTITRWKQELPPVEKKEVSVEDKADIPQDLSEENPTLHEEELILCLQQDPQSLSKEERREILTMIADILRDEYNPDSEVSSMAEVLNEILTDLSLPQDTYIQWMIDAGFAKTANTLDVIAAHLLHVEPATAVPEAPVEAVVEEAEQAVEFTAAAKDVSEVLEGLPKVISDDVRANVAFLIVWSAAPHYTNRKTETPRDDLAAACGIENTEDLIGDWNRDDVFEGLAVKHNKSGKATAHHTTEVKQALSVLNYSDFQGKPSRGMSKALGGIVGTVNISADFNHQKKEEFIKDVTAESLAECFVEGWRDAELKRRGSSGTIVRRPTQNIESHSAERVLPTTETAGRPVVAVKSGARKHTHRDIQRSEPVLLEKLGEPITIDKDPRAWKALQILRTVQSHMRGSANFAETMRAVFDLQQLPEPDEELVRELGLDGAVFESDPDTWPTLVSQALNDLLLFSRNNRVCKLTQMSTGFARNTSYIKERDRRIGLGEFTEDDFLSDELIDELPVHAEEAIKEVLVEEEAPTESIGIENEQVEDIEDSAGEDVIEEPVPKEAVSTPGLEAIMQMLTEMRMHMVDIDVLRAEHKEEVARLTKEITRLTEENTRQAASFSELERQVQAATTMLERAADRHTL